MARGATRWSVLLGSLALVLALIAPFTVALSKRDLYQHTGSDSNVLETDNNGMLLSAEAILKTPIVFYDKIYNSIFYTNCISAICEKIAYNFMILYIFKQNYARDRNHQIPILKFTFKLV
ncbi:hypothetical protein G5I_10175 [Acromyrmex echinatior]|uniref:Uncharacterized protein n=1 Tax=Acromyrmex echinatior TaxID=103372 RepID=F4WW21_ACREC|nr:hypothetical protein G5I_10175 [Acromyrmex echinatior]